MVPCGVGLHQIVTCGQPSSTSGWEMTCRWPMRRPIDACWSRRVRLNACIHTNSSGRAGDVRVHHLHPRVCAPATNGKAMTYTVGPAFDPVGSRLLIDADSSEE